MSKRYASAIRSLLAGAACAAALIHGSGAAQAGTCPADKQLKQPRAVEDAPDVGIRRETLSVVNVTGWRNLGDLRLRTRRLTVAVGGIVPFHRHDDRPSIVYVASGEIIEHSAFCSVPIVHRTGDWTPEFGPGHAHWWENKSGKEVVLLSSDIVPPDMLDDPDM
jgi:quercetin dioxygenase-like cupin family protein